MTNHLSEEELILHYYGETPRAAAPRLAEHLASCGECEAANTRLHRVLTLVDSAPPVDARPGFERDVWARLEPQLDEGLVRRLVRRSAVREGGSATREGGWRTFFWAPQWALAGGVAALVVVAFMAGRISNGTDVVLPAPQRAAASPERVLHAAVGDHLDRTQMMLVELVNADTDQLDQLAGEQARASDLVAANRLMRQSAEQSGDGAIADILEDLERVLLEIANAPADVTSNELSDLKSRITTEDLLFRVRVIASEMRQRNRTDREAGDRPAQRLPVS
ncbi:MAG: hypothetical protein Q7R30_00705 [Acidobacteriota bacterium]|nr:hypothetical protein [Acidobacteriota bacterium]